MPGPMMRPIDHEADHDRGVGAEITCVVKSRRTRRFKDEGGARQQDTLGSEQVEPQSWGGWYFHPGIVHA